MACAKFGPSAMVAAVEKEMEARAMGISLTPQERFEVFGEHDPAQTLETRVGVVELLQGRAFDKPLPLPKGTPIDLTLDTSLNLDELLASYFGKGPLMNAPAPNGPE